MDRLPLFYCNECKSYKEKSEFNIRGRGDNPEVKSYYQSYCKPCASKKVKKSKDKNIDKHKRRQKEWRLKKKYGITFDEEIELKKNGCNICGGNVRLAIDHCHDTGKIRGVLCMNCNIALGLVKDDINTLKSLIEYLEK